MQLSGQPAEWRPLCSPALTNSDVGYRSVCPFAPDSTITLPWRAVQGWAVRRHIQTLRLASSRVRVSSTGYFIVGTPDSTPESISFSGAQASSSAASEPSTWLPMASLLGSAAILRTRKTR